MVAKMKLFCFAAAAIAAAMPVGAADGGDPGRGAKLFGACAACHSLEKGKHMTGPSLAKIWGRKAGTMEGFPRYSEALKRSGVVWNEKTLDTWLQNPAAFVPGNWMPFQGIPDAQARKDVIAFLKSVSEEKTPSARPSAGMMASRERPDLRKPGAENRVTEIRHCKDSYYVTLATGERMAFWEPNLRFKTDSSEHGPARNKPVMVPAGMMGDRAQVVFSSPDEISPFIKPGC